jgi:hypothetical protein
MVTFLSHRWFKGWVLVLALNLVESGKRVCPCGHQTKQDGLLLAVRSYISLQLKASRFASADIWRAIKRSADFFAADQSDTHQDTHQKKGCTKRVLEDGIVMLLGLGSTEAASPFDFDSRRRIRVEADVVASRL